MTDKELLYIEDVLGHLEQFDAVATDYASKVSDKELGNLLSELLNEIKEINDNVYGLLNN